MSTTIDIEKGKRRVPDAETVRQAFAGYRVQRCDGDNLRCTVVVDADLTDHQAADVLAKHVRANPADWSVRAS